MEAYIKGLGIISPQKTFDTSDFLSDVVEHNSRYLPCFEPSYKDFLNPTLARRMARIIKMSIAASTVCLKDAGIIVPDAIMTGTALGCLEDTEKFLLAIIENEEQFLTPTSFIQSTHNTVSAQIALQLKCMNYNFTYVHKGFSFESALLDGLMTIAVGEAKNVLIGVHDEMTDKYYRVCDRIGYWKKETLPTMELINSKTNGSIAGEGSAFFMFGSEKSEGDYAKLRDVKTIYKPENKEEIENKITELLNERGLTAKDIDVVIYGINGDVRFDKTYYNLRDNYFKNSTATYFKHLCGEYQTAGSFALWLAAMMLKKQEIPKAVLIGANNARAIKNIIIYNTFLDADHSVYLLSQC
ncbi:MAG: beta-ketoacyl synthase chain length factor [Bacteroidetes bacterium]|nr:beta-ketoacyl synthase chain length factor [Bacteroidota bacterium]